MKICIPTENNEGLKSNVFAHFGSAPYFFIFDETDENFEIINNANAHHAHGMCQPLSQISGKNINVVVCGGIGARAIQKLNNEGIKAYQASCGTVAEIIKEFKENKLEEITVNNACADHGCH
ncbi:MAG: NifB/NifX family molybdenum-iron cluster-binding protein [Candidatus Omnitrophota bacterium]